MSIPYVVDGETDLDSTTINGWIDGINGDAGPLANMRDGQFNALDESNVDPTGDSDSYAGIQSAIDRAEDASASVANTHGVDVVIPPGTYLLSQRLVVPHGVRVRGYGSRSTVLLADPSISTADVVRLGRGDTLAEHGMQLHNLRIDCNDVAGSIGVLTENTQEPAGVFECVITGFRKYGVQVEDQPGGTTFTPSHFTMKGCELFFSCEEADAAIRVAKAANTTYIEQTTIAGECLDGQSTVGIDGTDAALVLLGVHFERVLTGVHVTLGSGNKGSLVASSLTGHPSCDLIVSITDNIPAVLMNIATLGSAKAVVDSNTGFDSSLHSMFTVPFYTTRSMVGGGVIAHRVTTVTGATTLNDTQQTVLADATSAGFTIVLPTAVNKKGRSYTIKKIDNANNVVVDGQSTQTIDGALTKTLTTQYAFLTIISDGANWQIVAQGGTIS